MNGSVMKGSVIDVVCYECGLLWNVVCYGMWSVMECGLLWNVVCYGMWSVKECGLLWNVVC